MKSLLPLLLAPVLSLAAATGSVTLLDGTPVSGAVIKSLTDSVTTSTTGTFVLGRTSGISSRLAKTVSVSSHLTVENGRPRLSFAGMDIAGRARSTATARQNLSSPGARFATRSTGTPDTLKVYWKGKRLTVLPVTSDTTVTFRIDTAWKDDAGIPWNPSITYGSLYDARDGQTYRTVTVGDRTWMAENLNIDTLHSVCDQDSARCSRTGRLYPQTYLKTRNSSGYMEVIHNRRGVCMAGWHIPTYYEWDSLTYSSGGQQTAGPDLKSTTGWDSNGNGSDLVGFRAIPASVYYERSSTSWYRNNLCAYFWTSTISGSEYMKYVDFQYNDSRLSSYYRDDTHSGLITHYSIRCIKD